MFFGTLLQPRRRVFYDVISRNAQLFISSQPLVPKRLRTPKYTGLAETLLQIITVEETLRLYRNRSFVSKPWCMFKRSQAVAVELLAVPQFNIQKTKDALVSFSAPTALNLLAVSTRYI